MEQTAAAEAAVWMKRLLEMGGMRISVRLRVDCKREAAGLAELAELAAGDESRKAWRRRAASK
jgi:hypothetical protein